MTDRRTSPLVKALAWFFAFAGVVVIFGFASGEKESQAAQPSEAEVLAAQALALMSPEERDALEASRKAEAAEEATRKQYAESILAAQYHCREAVRRRLHDPRSVQWDESPGWASTIQDDGTVHVQPRYRARNPMGGVAHEVVNCYVNEAEGTVRIAAL